MSLFGVIKAKRRVLAWVLLAVFLWQIRDVVGYLAFPDRSLAIEAGWRSLRDDRSARIRFLLWYGADPNALVDMGHGYRPLHEAVHWGNLASTKQLVAAGADVNASIVGSSVLALDIACKYASADVVQFLVNAGARRVRSTPIGFDGLPTDPNCSDPGAK